MQWSRQHGLGAAVLLVVILFAILIQKGLWKGGFFHEGRFNDFRAYDLAARGIWERDLIPSYRDEKRPNLYPPTFAILVAPLGLLPPKTALLAWVLLNVCIALYIFRRLGAILAVPLTVPARVAGFLLVYRLLESDFSNGNANVLVLGLILGAFDWAR
ncbi:MAG TPA: glycosyltransferase family 87 protein, partial [Planctomycetota bacterium]|nr:glycosyltransferase family 87 protein [Planctomycetota bacterium]